MSRIWETLRKLPQHLWRGSASKDSLGLRQEQLDRRRSSRQLVNVPLFVYGHASEIAPFYEETIALSVNSHGGLLTLAACVQPGQKLLLTNKITKADQECRVVHLRPQPSEKTDVAIEFTYPAPDFWQTES